MITKKKDMDMQTILIIILVGIAAGILGGLVGVGGGIIIVPALVYFIGFSQKTAQGTSLALIMLPVGIFGVLQYYKQGHVDFRIAGILAIGFLAGSYFGSKVALSLPQDTVKKIFAMLMIVIAIKMLFFDKIKKTGPEAKMEQEIKGPANDVSIKMNGGNKN
ncbi:MAG TPA: sulfite exporter TauE/SafE family protein [Ferruginibacter sp.]|nr:sulfite exporter TauE/SafE family protein [Ferruginibacter sp.]